MEPSPRSAHDQFCQRQLVQEVGLSDIAIRLQNVSKTFEIYKRPSDRLKQIVWGKRRKFYDEFQAIRNISLEIYRGETVGVVGRNGAGKSTLLQIICGTLQARHRAPQPAHGEHAAGRPRLTASAQDQRLRLLESSGPRLR